MKNSAEKFTVFEYTDVRSYLADYYQYKKNQQTDFSYRSFSEKTGINSVGLYKDVVEGRQKLGRNLIKKFSLALNHGKREAEYFAHMVHFTDSKTAKDRNLFFKKMMACYESSAYKVESDKFEYYSKWYYSAGRALVSIMPVKNNFKEGLNYSSLYPQFFNNTNNF